MIQSPVNLNIATRAQNLQGYTLKHLIVTSWNYSFQDLIYVIVSRVKTLNRLLLVNGLKSDLTKYHLIDNLKNKTERFDNLDVQFRIDINWGQKKKWFGFINC